MTPIDRTFSPELHIGAAVVGVVLAWTGLFLRVRARSTGRDSASQAVVHTAVGAVGLLIVAAVVVEIYLWSTGQW